jgi:hypothetical protein
MPVANTRETVAEIYELAEAGLGHRKIAAKLGVSTGAVGHYLRNPARFDPYLDEVAIARALGGDRPVYDNLTHWEWKAFLERLGTIRDSLTPEEYQDYTMALTRRLAPSDEVDRNLVRERLSAALRVNAA